MGVSDYYAGIARDHADDPDDWSDSEIWQSYHHYYNPNTHTGYAPSNCEYYANIAKTNYGDSQLTTAYTNLGYSSHYLQDVGNFIQAMKLSRVWINGFIMTMKIM